MEFVYLIASALLAFALGVVNNLLRKRDDQQTEFIKDLYDKHEKDAAKLAALELLIAGRHYSKDEIDNLFKYFRSYLDERFNRLETALDRRENSKHNGDKQ